MVANTFGYDGLQLNQFIVLLGIYISNERNMFVAENFIRSLVDKYGKHTVYTDGGTWYPQQACTFLHLKHRLYTFTIRKMFDRKKE